tara:strand:+ start:3780 stop:4421 length:642 start_codon:yes stop_codon:yes gene_type:complete
MKKVILWDNDGILVDTEQLYFDATKEILKELNIDLTKELYIEYSLKKGLSMFDLAVNLSNSQKEEFRKKRDKLYEEYLATKEITVKGVKELLEKLQGKIKMGVVTSSRKVHFDIIHKRTDFLKYFDFVLVREDYENSKPWPDPYLKGVELSGHDVNECVAIEDSERGLVSANAAGVDCVVIPGLLTEGSDFSKSLKVLKSLEELEGFLMDQIQ